MKNSDFFITPPPPPKEYLLFKELLNIAMQFRNTGDRQIEIEQLKILSDQINKYIGEIPLTDQKIP